MTLKGIGFGPIRMACPDGTKYTQGMQKLNRVSALFLCTKHGIYLADKIHDPVHPELPCNIEQIKKESQERRRIKPDSPRRKEKNVFPLIIITRPSIVWL